MNERLEALAAAIYGANPSHSDWSALEDWAKNEWRAAARAALAHLGLNPESPPAEGVASEAFAILRARISQCECRKLGIVGECSMCTVSRLLLRGEGSPR